MIMVMIMMMMVKKYFTIKDTKLRVPVVNLSARDNRKLSKLLGKRFKRSVSWNEY